MVLLRASIFLPLLCMVGLTQGMTMLRSKAEVDSMKAGHEQKVVPSVDDVATRLRALNESLDKIAEVIDNVNGTAYNMSSQFMEATGTFTSILETLRRGVRAASSLPLGGNVAQYADQAEKLILIANSTIVKAQTKVESAVERVNRKLGEIMPKLRELAGKIVENFEEAAEKIQSLSNDTQESVSNATEGVEEAMSSTTEAPESSTTPVGELSAMQIRKHGMSLLMSKSIPLLNRGPENACKVCSNKNKKANNSLIDLSDKVNDVNQTAADLLGAVLASATDVLATLNTTVESALQAADAVPDRLLHPVRQNLGSMLAVGARMSGQVDTQSSLVDSNVADASQALSAGFILSDALEDSVQDACLSGVCGAAAEKQCRGEENPHRGRMIAIIAAICFAVLCFVGYYFSSSSRAE